MNAYRLKRIQKVLSAPTNRVLDEPVVKRILSIITIASAYIYLAALLIPYSNKSFLLIKLMFVAGGLPWWMIVSFILLRSSMRRITSLPDEYLDEREIGLRDSSFKLGYLVVRRLGLALSALVVLEVAATWVVYYLTPMSYTYNPVHEVTWYEAAIKAINEYVTDVLGEAPVLTLGSLVILLTYVAYSFPLIILAWRDARNKREIVELPSPEVKIDSLAQKFEKTSKVYFRLLIGVAISIPVAFLSVMLMFVLPIFGLLTVAAFAFGPFVYLWAEIKLIIAIFSLKFQNLNLPRRKQLTRLASFASISGAVVPVSFVVAIFNNQNAGPSFWVAIAGGFAAVGCHVAAFISLRLASVELTSGETTSS